MHHSKQNQYLQNFLGGLVFKDPVQWTVIVDPFEGQGPFPGLRTCFCTSRAAILPPWSYDISQEPSRALFFPRRAGEETKMEPLSSRLRSRRKRGRGRNKARKRGKGKGAQSPSLFPFLPIPYPFRRLLRRLVGICIARGSREIVKRRVKYCIVAEKFKMLKRFTSFATKK